LTAAAVTPDRKRELLAGWELRRATRSRQLAPDRVPVHADKKPRPEAGLDKTLRRRLLARGAPPRRRAPVPAVGVCSLELCCRIAVAGHPALLRQPAGVLDGAGLGLDCRAGAVVVVVYACAHNKLLRSS
jgi:hypothetical protein